MPSSHLNRRAWIALLAAAWVAPAGATTVSMMSDSSLAAQSELVVVARSLGTVPAPELDRPVTDYLMEVERLLQGSLDGSALLVRVPGGEAANGMALKIWGAPVFADGERALLFLNRASDGSYRIVQLVLGAFHESTIEGRRVAYRDLSEVDVVDADTAASRRERRLRDFDRFADWLADRAAGQIRRRDYFFRSAESSQNLLLPMYNLFLEDGKNLRWFEFDRGNSVGWRLDPDGFPGLGSSGQTELEAALAAWNNEPQTPIRYEYRGTSGVQLGFKTFDGQNVVLFEDPNDDVEGSFSCPGGGTLAVGGPWYSTSTTAVFNGRTYIRIQGADIVLNDGVECYFSRPSAGRSAASELFAHELGHTLGLAHSSENDNETNPTLRDALMYYHLHSDGRGASLRSDDLAAIRALYTTGGGGGGGGGSGSCPAGTLCLVNGRFRVTAVWNNQYNGLSGSAGAIANTDVSGFMYFDDGANIELIVKILDFGNVFKVFYGQLTDLRFTMSILDTVTGVSKTYTNTPGDCGAIDNAAFSVALQGRLQPATLAPFVAGTCRASDTTLCLQANRIQVSGTWRNQYNGTSGVAQVTPLSQVTGGLYFLDRTNLEVLVKAVDFGTYFLLIYGSLSDFEYHLTVTDTVTGASRIYDNPAGRYCGAIDGTTFVK